MDKIVPGENPLLSSAGARREARVDPYATTLPNDEGLASGPGVPAQFGRYRVTAKIGEGGFGAVYRGHDDQLRRDVAIKVPRRERIATTSTAWGLSSMNC